MDDGAELFYSRKFERQLYWKQLGAWIEWFFNIPEELCFLLYE